MGRIQTTSPEVQTGGTRGILAGGYDDPAKYTDMDYINVETTGNAIDFGNLASSAFYGAGFGSRTHGFIAGNSPTSNTIQRWVVASTGSAEDYSQFILTVEHINLLV